MAFDVLSPVLNLELEVRGGWVQFCRDRLSCISIPAQLCISADDKHILDTTLLESLWKRERERMIFS